MSARAGEVIFAGVSSRQNRLITRVTNYPILPAPKFNLIDNTFGDGIIDVSNYNPKGRQLYNEKTIDVEVGLDPHYANVPDKNTLCILLAQWLTATGAGAASPVGGYYTLEVPNAPGRVWWAKVNSDLALQDVSYKRGRVIVQFRCKPYDINGNLF